MQNTHVDLLTVNISIIVLIQIGQDKTSLTTAATEITTEIKSHIKSSSLQDTNSHHGFPDSVLSQLHLTHSTSVEFLRQFWLTYLSAKSPAKKKELDSLGQSLKRTQERMDAVRVYAVKEGGEAMGRRVTEVLGSISGSVNKAVG